MRQIWPPEKAPSTQATSRPVETQPKLPASPYDDYLDALDEDTDFDLLDKMTNKALEDRSLLLQCGGRQNNPCCSSRDNEEASRGVPRAAAQEESSHTRSDLSADKGVKRKTMRWKYSNACSCDLQIRWSDPD